eukprot:TRINITY_DN27800_c0_g1_i1.p1 TRINITY_DN27800_c0_g1~~TRINITY_DN27800_c0_g1_i1.p1  ORF type:complete len:849 (+),score=121.02 TRINITY_DN27800_c0_g1_i1:117-2663(+)
MAARSQSPSPATPRTASLPSASFGDVSARSSETTSQRLAASRPAPLSAGAAAAVQVRTTSTPSSQTPGSGKPPLLGSGGKASFVLPVSSTPAPPSVSSASMKSPGGQRSYVPSPSGSLPPTNPGGGGSAASARSTMASSSATSRNQLTASWSAAQMTASLQALISKPQPQQPQRSSSHQQIGNEHGNANEGSKSVPLQSARGRQIEGIATADSSWRSFASTAQSRDGTASTGARQFVGRGRATPQTDRDLTSGAKADSIGNFRNRSVNGGSAYRPAARTFRSQAPAVQPRLNLNDYKRLEDVCDLHKKVGSGSAGDVYLATHRETGSRVAVKIISMDKLRRTGVQEAALAREIDAMQNVTHRNIVRFVDVAQTYRMVTGVTEKPPFLCIAMEYIPNSRPLSWFIRTQGEQAGRALSVLPQLADAMSAMHAAGYVHRDIWSENILVAPDGEIKILDLGCSCRYRDGPNVENRMNLPYMSPQASTWERQQPGDDCWATGCLLVEMVTGTFLADATGRSDIPLHQRPEVLEQYVARTIRQDRVLGEIAAQLLDRHASARLTMKELSRLLPVRSTIPAQLNAEAAPLTEYTTPSPVAATVRSARPSACSAPSPCRMPSDPSETSTVSTAASPPMAENLFVAGTVLKYQARTHEAEYQAVVVERAPGQGVIIQVAGTEKLVEENELWRLTPFGATEPIDADEAPSFLSFSNLQISPQASPLRERIATAPPLTMSYAPDPVVLEDEQTRARANSLFVRPVMFGVTASPLLRRKGGDELRQPASDGSTSTGSTPTVSMTPKDSSSPQAGQAMADCFSDAKAILAEDLLSSGAKSPIVRPRASLRERVAEVVPPFM